MGFSKNHKFFTLQLILIILCIWGFQESLGMRPLEEEDLWLKSVVQSLQRGPVPPSGSNPCTYIPGFRRRGRCALAENEINIANPGHHNAAGASPPALVMAFPEVAVHFAIASNDKETSS
ncbi:hypothetical protein LguiA_031878 [Lonicera macranthoides]